MKKIWDIWELIAIKYLKEKWYKIIETNFKYSKIWEIDIISTLWDLTIFIEVKYRKNDKFWVWEESVNFSKKQKIKETIMFYSFKNNLDLENIRFDIISILWEKINHYENVEI